MLDDHLSSPVTRRRLRAGPAANHVDDFADWLHRRGYRPSPVTQRLMSLAGWTDWMQTMGFTAERLAEGYSACVLALADEEWIPYRGGPKRDSLIAARLLIRFLCEEGLMLPPSGTVSPLDTWPILREYRSWARVHRGLADSTLDVRQGILVDLLRAVGDDCAAYTAEALRAFVLERARPHGVGRGKTIVSAVRSFVRFLSMTGRCSSGLEHGIPDFAGWSSSTVPRFMSAEDVERVIVACGGKDARGLRDHAVILLLARLGLRAADVAHLEIDDVDWKNGRIAVCGKGRRREWLPLPQQVGDALLAYLAHGRPLLNVPEVFLTIKAPLRPLLPWAVCGIAKAALRRAGLNIAVKGSHVFRHSAATNMLRQGVSLAGVGAVLRHRSPKSTLHYAKVDFGALSEIAQPWPVLSC